MRRWRNWEQRHPGNHPNTSVHAFPLFLCSLLALVSLDLRPLSLSFLLEFWFACFFHTPMFLSCISGVYSHLRLLAPRFLY